MKPIDPRLIARIGPARRYVVVTAILGLITAITVLLQALILARALAPLLAPKPLTEDGLGNLGALVPISARELPVAVGLLAGVLTVRVAVTYLQERLAYRAGAEVISELRAAVVKHARKLGPRWVASGEGAELNTVVTRGLDGLLPYFVRYLPQLLLATTVTPIMAIVVLGMDWISASIVAFTVPLIPIFMVLIGLMTQEKSARYLTALTRLGGRTLDLIAGIPTLRGLGRHRGPELRIRELGEAQRKATMGSLRVAFLSGMVLELLTTLSVALVAVTLGFRLVAGNVSIETALAILILAPEVYLPLRAVGLHFHASADGIAAAENAFRVLETKPVVMGDPAGPALDPQASIQVAELGIATPDKSRWAPAAASFTAEPGNLTVLMGPNGEGKTTLLLAIAGLLPYQRGSITVGGLELAGANLSTWWPECAWVPQRPDLGPSGRELSLGQRQLVALREAFTADRQIVLLDEPTAHLHPAGRAEVISLIRQQADRGATVLVSSHDTQLIEIADQVVEIRAQATLTSVNDAGGDE